MTPASQPYFTSLESRRHLDVILSSLYRKRPTIWNLMSGVGGDALGELMYLDPAVLELVDKQAPEEQACLHHNIGEMKRAFPEVFESTDTPKINIHHKFYDQFISEYAKQNSTSQKNPAHVDLVYLDPPWDRTKIHKEMHEMFQYAQFDAQTAEAKQRANETGQQSSKLDEIEVDLPVILMYINEIASLLQLFHIDVSTLCFKNRFKVNPGMFEELAQKHAKLLHANYSVLYSV